MLLEMVPEQQWCDEEGFYGAILLIHSKLRWESGLLVGTDETANI